MYDVGPYTLAPWKVVWREQASAMTVAVCGPLDGRPIIPDHKLMSVPVETQDEAEYVCAVLNSQTVADIVAAYTVKSSILPHVLEHVRVPPLRSRQGAACRDCGAWPPGRIRRCRR